jgi:DNA repair exonuclease SbcCD ATPase subunit
MMDGEERKIAALVAAFDQEHERAQRAIGALEKIGERLQQDVQSAARDAVMAALAEVHQETEQAVGALRALQRFSFWQSAWQHVTIAALAMAVTVACVWGYVPSLSEITALRAEQSALQASIEDLHQRGALIKLNTCGPRKHVCVLVDQTAGTFGEGPRGEVYMIAKGY